jgi:hypothetical protein
MSTPRRALSLVVASLLCTSAAIAQSDATAPTAPTADSDDAPVEVRYRARTTISIEDAQIEGTVKGPTTYRVQARGKTKFRNLIELRANFRPELHTSPGAL